jgi:hypothetical protein
MKAVSYLAVLAAGMFVAGSANSAVGVANGSFETPTVPAGGFTTFSVGSSSITNWLVIGPAGTNVAIVSGTFSQDGVTFEAQDGTQWLDLTGDNSNSIEGVQQSVTTIPNHLYQLSYYIGNTTGGGIFGTTSRVLTEVGANAFTHTNSNVDDTGLNWEQFTDNFVATATSTLITFENLDPPNDNSNGLDNIVLTDLGPVGAPVPEPAAIGLFASMLLSLGLARRRL